MLIYSLIQAKKRNEEIHKEFMEKYAEKDEEIKEIKRQYEELKKQEEEKDKNQQEAQKSVENNEMMTIINMQKELIKTLQEQKPQIDIKKILEEQEEKWKNEKKAEEDAKRKKTDEELEKLKKGLEKVISDEKKTVMKDFEKLEDEWCIDQESKDQIKKLIAKEIGPFLDEVKDFYQIHDLIFRLIQNLMDLVINIGKPTKFNAFIMGNTGVGKSTFINAIFDEDVAKESSGSVGTVFTYNHHSKKYPFLSFFDTQGIEHDERCDIEKVKINAKKEIENQLQEDSCDTNIHCLLYFTTGSRFEEIECKVIQFLRETYPDKQLPIIVVYTKATNPEDINGVRSVVEKSFNNENISDKILKIEFIDVVSKEFNLVVGRVPIKNLAELMKRVGIKSQFAVQAAAKESLRKRIKVKLMEKFDSNKKKMSKTKAVREILLKNFSTKFPDCLKTCITQILQIEDKKKKNPSENKRKEETTKGKNTEEEDLIKEKKNMEIKKNEKKEEEERENEVSSPAPNPLKEQKSEEEIKKYEEISLDLTKAILKLIDDIISSKLDSFLNSYSKKSSEKLCKKQFNMMVNSTEDLREGRKSIEDYEELMYKEYKDMIEEKANKIGKANLGAQVYEEISSYIYKMIKDEVINTMKSQKFKEYVNQRIGKDLGVDIKKKFDKILIPDLLKREEESKKRCKEIANGGYSKDANGKDNEENKKTPTPNTPEEEDEELPDF